MVARNLDRDRDRYFGDLDLLYFILNFDRDLDLVLYLIGDVIGLTALVFRFFDKERRRLYETSAFFSFISSLIVVVVVAARVF